MSNDKGSEKGKKKVHPAVTCGVMLFLFIVLAAGCSSMLSGTDTPQVPQEDWVYVTEDASTERVIEEKIIEVLGYEANMGDVRMMGIEISPWNEGDEVLDLSIDYVADENFGSYSQRGMLSDVEDIVKNISPLLDENVGSITVSAYLTLVDQYGNEELTKVMLTSMSKEVWEQINWDNFIQDNIPDLADWHWEHPAIQE